MCHVVVLVKVRNAMSLLDMRATVLCIVAISVLTTFICFRYIQEDILHPTDSLYHHFSKVFETFKVSK